MLRFNHKYPKINHTLYDLSHTIGISFRQKPSLKILLDLPLGDVLQQNMTAWIYASQLWLCLLRWTIFWLLWWLTITSCVISTENALGDVQRYKTNLGYTFTRWIYRSSVVARIQKSGQQMAILLTNNYLKNVIKSDSCVSKIAGGRPFSKNNQFCYHSPVSCSLTCISLNFYFPSYNQYNCTKLVSRPLLNYPKNIFCMYKLRGDIQRLPFRINAPISVYILLCSQRNSRNG